MTFGVSEVAKTLSIDGKTVKDWSYHFSDHLSSSANPPKGNIRYYNLDDIRVLAYISMYWEDTPDFENIRYGLNSKNYNEIESITNLITQITPLFRDFDEDDMGRRDGVLFGGMAPLGDFFVLANAYKLAGDKLIEETLADSGDYELICPIIYQYRHATELFLKSIIGKELITHKYCKNRF